MMLLILLPACTALLPPPRQPPVNALRRTVVGGLAAALVPRPALAADTITFDVLLKNLKDSTSTVERVEFLDATGNTAFAIIGGARLDVTGIPPDLPFQNLGPLKLAAICRDLGVRAPVTHEARHARSTARMYSME